MTAAIYTDVSTALARPISDPAEQQQVTWWLTGIEAVIRARLGSLEGVDQGVLRYVEAEAVAAKVRRKGTTETSITVAVDDGSVTRRYEDKVDSSDITDEWWNMLDPDSNTGTGSIRPGFEPDSARWPVSTPGDCWPDRDGWRYL